MTLNQDGSMTITTLRDEFFSSHGVHPLLTISVWRIHRVLTRLSTVPILRTQKRSCSDLVMSKTPVQPVATIQLQNEAMQRVLARSDSKVALVQESTTSSTGPEASSQVVLSLYVGGKLLNFNRKSTDLISQVLTRMKISCAKALKEPVPQASIEGDAPPKKMQKGERSPLPDPEIQFRSSDGVALVEGTLSEVLDQSTDISIESEKYRIVRDPPLVTSLEIDSNLWVGFPLVASWSCVGAPEDEFTFEWLVMSGENQEVIDTIRSGQVFIPESSHVGHYLEVRCYHPSFPEFYLSTAHVDRIEKFPGEKEARLEAPLKSPDLNSIRVASFNILAQPYLRTPLAQDVYYTHLHKCWYLTEWTRRLPLILREMTDTDSDIYCLQEVAGGSHETQLKRAISTTHDWHFFGKE